MTKFDQVSSDDHQVSVAGRGKTGGSQVWYPGAGGPRYDVWVGGLGPVGLCTVRSNVS